MMTSAWKVSLQVRGEGHKLTYQSKNAKETTEKLRKPGAEGVGTAAVLRGGPCISIEVRWWG